MYIRLPATMASDATASRSGAQQHAPSEEAAGEDRVDDRGAAVRFHVAAGTYEHMIYGVEFCVEPDEEGRIVEEVGAIDHSHRCLRTQGWTLSRARCQYLHETYPPIHHTLRQ